MLKTVSVQSLLVGVTAAIGILYWGVPGGRDILLGGMACIIPNMLFARMLWRVGRRSSQVFVTAFLVGEILKLALTLLFLMAIVRWLTPTHWGAVLLGIIIALQAPWLQVIIQHRDNQIHTVHGVQRGAMHGS